MPPTASFQGQTHETITQEASDVQLQQPRAIESEAADTIITVANSKQKKRKRVRRKPDGLEIEALAEEEGKLKGKKAAKVEIPSEITPFDYASAPNLLDTPVSNQQSNHKQRVMKGSIWSSLGFEASGLTSLTQASKDWSMGISQHLPEPTTKSKVLTRPRPSKADSITLTFSVYVSGVASSRVQMIVNRHLSCAETPKYVAEGMLGTT